MYHLVTLNSSLRRPATSSSAALSAGGSYGRSAQGMPQIHRAAYNLDLKTVIQLLAATPLAPTPNTHTVAHALLHGCLQCATLDADQAELIYHLFVRSPSLVAFFDSTDEGAMVLLARVHLRRNDLDACGTQCDTLLRVNAEHEEALNK